jgi:hypothetical protein
MGCGSSSTATTAGDLGEKPDYTNEAVIKKPRTNTGFNRILLKVILLGDSK